MTQNSEVLRLRTYFNEGNSLSYDWRRAQLLALHSMIEKEANNMAEALWADLHKSFNEAWLTEIGFLKMELEHALKHLKAWMRAERKPSPLAVMLAKSYVQRIPMGLVLIISPWNYPLQLTLAPLISAIAAGNVAVLKPSEYSPHTTAFLQNTLLKYLDPSAFAIVEGGPSQTQALLKERFDTIFFTGSAATARHIARAAAEHLTPTTLELGGKSPTVVWEPQDMEVTARRIVWAKYTNAGQTCVAPDYVLVKESEMPALLEAMMRNVKALYGEVPQDSADYGRIINDRHFERLEAMLKQGEILYGGRSDANTKFIEPTIMGNIQEGSALLSEEIFGPILPVLPLHNKTEIFSHIAKNPEPLACYLYSGDKALQQKMVQQIRAGGMCINDSLMHLANVHLPFGGVGQSGMGQCHGKYGFDTFSHPKAVLHNSTKMDMALRYPPYGEGWLKWIKRLM